MTSLENYFFSALLKEFNNLISHVLTLLLFFCRASLCELYRQGRGSRAVRKVSLQRERGQGERKPSAEFPLALHYESHELRSASLCGFALTPSLLPNKRLNQPGTSIHIPATHSTRVLNHKTKQAST